MDQILSQTRFNGGISEDFKDGIQGSFYAGRGLDFRTNPSQLTTLPAGANESGLLITNLVKWLEPIGTDMYALDAGGAVYKRASNATWTFITNLQTSHGNGLGYFPLDDCLYAAKDSDIDRYGPITPGSPSWSRNYFTDNVVNIDQLNTVASSFTQQYNIKQFLSENPTDRLTFTPSYDPPSGIILYVVNKGTTANWTLTVHDQANNVVSTQTFSNVNISTGFFTFVLPTWRITTGEAYHVHLTADSLTGSPLVTSSAFNDFSQAYFKSTYQVLVTETNWHPVKEFAGYLCFGNERYLAVYNGVPKEAGPGVFNPNRVSLPAGWKIRALEKTSEYIVMAAVKSNTVTDFDEGLLVFWDGSNPTMNFYVYMKDGAPCSISVIENNLYVITSAGRIYMYFNGFLYPVKVLPKMDLQHYVEVYPGAFTNWKGIMYFGVAGTSTNTNITKGIYSYGTINNKYPKALNMDFVVSTGTTTGTGLKIGAAKAIGSTLFYSWQDGSSYGVDTVTPTSVPLTSSLVELMIHDDQKPYKQKSVESILASHTPLKSGESVQLGYKLERAGSYTTNTANTTVGSVKSKLDINARYTELQTEIILGSGTTSPVITGMFAFYDDLSEERFF